MSRGPRRRIHPLETPPPELGPEVISVEVSDTQTHLRIDPSTVVELVSSTLKLEGVRHAAISIALVDDVTIRALNVAHLGHDWPTDVISFGLSEAGESQLIGEIVVSAETAAATARREKVNPGDELALYVVHGLLHLCGHDDSTPGGRDSMRRRQGEVLRALGIVNTFPAASGEPEVEAAFGERESVRWIS